MKQIIRTTRSVCPVCLKNLPAQLRREEDGRILLEKTCPEHGPFQVPVWRGLMDFDRWLLETEPLPETQGRRCPARCGICAEQCPMGSISFEDPSDVPGLCIKCQACVKYCPQGAKRFTHPDFLSHKAMLERDHSKPAKNRFFF